jgi:hypothetical protein
LSVFLFWPIPLPSSLTYPFFLNTPSQLSLRLHPFPGLQMSQKHSPQCHISLCQGLQGLLFLS